eukprot:TRINITY_DN23_c1_g1_i9.p2 TRINITY_DN23_c1_g1~~TRINITY_DN23_c1_g1_i9.p2  ORF type:complete len:234 (+),score=1.11 TRINITY_DN23_c1_g1_i9:382-1083(+)
MRQNGQVISRATLTSEGTTLDQVVNVQEKVCILIGYHVIDGMYTREQLQFVPTLGNNLINSFVSFREESLVLTFTFQPTVRRWKSRVLVVQCEVFGFDFVLLIIDDVLLRASLSSEDNLFPCLLHLYLYTQRHYLAILSPIQQQVHLPGLHQCSFRSSTTMFGRSMQGFTVQKCQVLEMFGFSTQYMSCSTCKIKFLFSLVQKSVVLVPRKTVLVEAQRLSTRPLQVYQGTSR